jgi:hypothetical protein
MLTAEDYKRLSKHAVELAIASHDPCVARALMQLALDYTRRPAKLNCDGMPLFATKQPNVGRGPASNPTITGKEPEWHVHSIEWDRAHLVEQAL